MPDNPSYSGGCHCGDVRFEVNGRPRLTEYCHCRSCRTTVGAPVMAWAGVGQDQFRIVSGRPSIYVSSPGVTRGFCARCGTSLVHGADAYPDEIYVAIAALDDAAELAPAIHIWRSEKLPWLETTDECPRYTGFQSGGRIE